MQAPNFVDQILELFMDPFILIVTLWVFGIIIAVAIFRRKPKGPKDPAKSKKQKQKQKKPKGKVKGHLMKQMQKMSNEAEKGKPLSVPPVHSRQELITQMFESKTSAIGLEASTSSGYVPVSYTPFAKFLKDRHVPDDIISAMLEGIMEEETEEGVKDIVDASSPELGFVGNELEKAKTLAVDEWRNVKKTAAS